MGVLLVALVVPPGSAASASSAESASQKSSVRDAYTFLDQMMDLYATAGTPRLVQSFTGGVLQKQQFTDSETYDDALVIDAFLTEGSPDGLFRAETLGNALLYVQAHDPLADGRIREAYAPTPLTGAKAMKITDKTSDVGNMAWVGMAFSQLYRATGSLSYLTGGEAIGNWIVKNSLDTRGSGGFTGGRSGSNHPIRWKSTEHNIDLYAFFTMLTAETGSSSWAWYAQWALRFVRSMWNSSSGDFYVGTLHNGTTANTREQPEDVNSWSYLALADSAYASSIDWDVQHLSVSDGPLSGTSFCAGDRSGVWYEGTAHLATALELRNSPGDAALAAQYLADIAYVQANGPDNDGLGIIAASKNRLSDCDGDYYYSSLHTGATAWYLFAASGPTNPFRLLAGA